MALLCMLIAIEADPIEVVEGEAAVAGAIALESIAMEPILMEPIFMEGMAMLVAAVILVRVSSDFELMSVLTAACKT